MMVVGIGFNRLADKTKRSVVNGKQAEISREMQTLFREQQLLERQIELLSNRPSGLNDILSSRPALDWAKILNDVKTRTPESVRITVLYDTGNAGMVLEGMALSYEAARLFMKMLNESDYIDSASLTETTREEQAGGLVLYTINCSLTIEKSDT